VYLTVYVCLVLTLLSQIVFNPSTYPNFLRFLKLYPPSNGARLPRLLSWVWGKSSAGPEVDTGICILPTKMTFSVSRDGGAFEWAGKSPATLFCQVRRLLDPQMWRMIYDILRFNACARRILLTPKNNDERDISIGEYLDNEGYSSAFRNNYLMVGPVIFFLFLLY
jgi:predicted NAD/FAD-binding protein